MKSLKRKDSCTFKREISLDNQERIYPLCEFNFLGSCARMHLDCNSVYFDNTMSPSAALEPSVKYLVPRDTVVETSGASLPFDLGPLAGKSVLIVLRVTDIIEQESLDVSIWGSADGKEWGAKPLFWYPQKFYRGVTPAALDLRQRLEIKFLQARWEVSRFGRGYPRPYFKFAVEIQELASSLT